MRRVLIVFAASIAAFALPAVPASAQSGGASFSNHGAQFSGQFTRSHDVRIHRGHDGRRGFGDFRRDRRRFSDFRDDRRRDRDFRGDVFLPYRDYQGDSLWRSDSFNDWWHDRPDRAFPRWVGANRKKCERLWWSGSGWHC